MSDARDWYLPTRRRMTISVTLYLGLEDSSSSSLTDDFTIKGAPVRKAGDEDVGRNGTCL